MSFAAPIWLAIAGMVAAGVVIAHIISTSVPDRDVLPTARFVPEGAPLTALRTRKITDWLLFVLRLLAVALLGLALAGAHVTRDAPTRVVIADLSRAVASPTEVRDSAMMLAVGDAPIVAMGARASVVTRDSLRTLAESREPKAEGRLSAALVAAHRAIAATPDGRNRTELVVVSPLAREEIDSATASLLALWPGAVRHVPVRASPPAPLAFEAIDAVGDDPVAAALAGRATARVLRAQPSGEDSAWAARGGALVVWPTRLEPTDTAQGIAAGAHVVIGHFARGREPRYGQVIARWLDGSPAATEQSHGAGCIRNVAIGADPVGDVSLRDNFRALARTLTAPCGGIPDRAPVTLAALGITERGRPRAAIANVLTPPRDLPTREGLWLALAALAVLVIEQLVRRRGRSA